MIRFGSRGSQLALAQTRIVGEALLAATGEAHEVVVIKTEGDRIQDRSLAGMEGKGFFTKEIEEALLDGRIDAAVHSYKDLPVAETPGLVVAAVLPREDPAECLVIAPSVPLSQMCEDAIQHDAPLALFPLREGATVGTSSPRRRAALLHLRPDLNVVDLRGNVNTRLQRVANGELDAALIAVAGLVRLGVEPMTDVKHLSTELITPAAAQGALAVQVREDDEVTRAKIEKLNAPITARCVGAERYLLSLLGGGCSVPLGVLVEPRGDRFRMDAVLFAEGSSSSIRVRLEGEDPFELARRAAPRLLPARTRPLTGKRLLLVRPERHPDRLVDALSAAGAEVHLLPVNRLVPIGPDPDVLAALERFRWIAVTSFHAAERLAEVLGSARRKSLAGARFAAVGEGTAEALSRTGLCGEPLVSESGTASGLASCLIELGCSADTPVLFPCAADPRPDLEDRLRAAGVTVTRLALYRTTRVERRELPRLPDLGFDFTLFTSPSGVDSFFALDFVPAGRAIAIGPTTARALESRGVKDFHVSPSPSPEGILTEILHP